MSKVKKYIEDAVKATAEQITTKGVEVSNCNFDSRVDVHVNNGDLTEVLLELAKAQNSLAQAVVKVSQSKPEVNNNSTGLSLTGLQNKPMEFSED